AASVAKKKSGPRPAQAVLSLNTFASKLAVIASCSPGLLDLARSMSCVAFNFCATEHGLNARQATKNKINAWDTSRRSNGLAFPRTALSMISPFCFTYFSRLELRGTE